jgi:hypothetical protein
MCATAQWSAIVDGASSLVSSAVDASGNSFLAGSFLGTNLLSAMFLVKYATNGTPLWNVRLTNMTLGSSSPRALAVDAAGNAFLAGSGGSTFTAFNADGSLSNAKNAGSSSTGIVVKYSSAGAALWVARVGTSVASVATDAIGNVYVAGKYNGATVIYNAGGMASTVTLHTAVTNSYFVVKLNAGGTAQWAASLQDVGPGSTPSVAVDPGDGAVYLAGSYGASAPVQIYGALDILSDFVTLRTPSGLAALLVKLGPDGTPLWAASVDGAGTESDVSVGVDQYGSVYLAGQYTLSDAVVYQADNMESDYSLPAPLGDVGSYVIRYDPSGAVDWRVRLDGSVLSVAVAPTGVLYVSGSYTVGPLLFYNADNQSYQVDESRPTGGGSTRFVAKYNTDGMAKWYVRVDGVPFASGASVVFGNGAVFMAGSYSQGPPPSIYDAEISSTNTNSVASDDVTLRASPNGSAYMIKFADEVTPSTYRLTSALAATDNGRIKHLLNASSTAVATVKVRDAANTTTLQTLAIQPKRKASVAWYDGEWYT